MKLNISKYAKEILKIDTIGFTDSLIPSEDIENYRNYLQAGNYEDMLWLETRQQIRENPNLLLDGVKTVIVVGANYYHNTSKKDYDISIYANQQQDYHIWLYEKVKLLSKFISNTYSSNNRYFVDSAPILEKVFAKKTSIGWQGKHTCIVSREFGSWLFLGVILTDLQIEPDMPHKNMCGTCTKCIDSCPTQALTPYKLETKKCISYLTIENKNDIDESLHKDLGDKIFGCDICLKACPFNKWQSDTLHIEAQENEKFPKSIDDFKNLKQEEFKKIFKNTPLQRTGYAKLQNNLDIAVKNKKMVDYNLN